MNLTKTFTTKTEQAETKLSTNTYTLQKVNDGYEIKKLLEENIQLDNVFQFSKRKEGFRFFRFSAQMLLAFPIGLLMRKLIRKNKRLNYILQFPELQSIRSNIEKGSFAYDTLLFKQLPHQIIQNKSHLANLVCLALLFGDEFIDGIATVYGKENIKTILNNQSVNYYLQHKKVNNKLVLYYEFDICVVLPQNVLETVNKKYEINYKAFYDHLQFLLTEMNLYLNKLDNNTAIQSAALICTVCNKCFDTYKVDVQEFNPNYDWNKLLDYQQSKDDEIIKILLELRATLLHKNKPKYQLQFASWANMVRSMQVYDDMQDIAGDCTYQMNFLAFFSKAFFTNEWEWLLQNKEALLTKDCLCIQQQIAVHMPAAMQLCLQYNKNISFKNLNWVQQKIQNYLWQKNWLHINNKLTQGNSTSIDIKEISKRILNYNNELFTEEMQYAQLIDIILLYPPERKKLFTILTKEEKYYLKNSYTNYPTYKKAILAKRFLQLMQ